jgi:hypothetical protein
LSWFFGWRLFDWWFFRRWFFGWRLLNNWLAR